MKKIMALLCALLMALSFVSCEDSSKKTCEHKWMDATCEEPKTCSRCDKTKGEALGHTWEDATCTAPKTCSVCEKTEGEALGHTWVDATCEAPKTCSVCKETEGEALGHDWDVQNCTRCSEIRNVGYKDYPDVPDFGYVFPTYLEPARVQQFDGFEGYFYSYDDIEKYKESVDKYIKLIKDFGFVQVETSNDGDGWSYKTPKGTEMIVYLTDYYFTICVFK